MHINVGRGHRECIMQHENCTRHGARWYLKLLDRLLSCWGIKTNYPATSSAQRNYPATIYFEQARYGTIWYLKCFQGRRPFKVVAVWFGVSPLPL